MSDHSLSADVVAEVRRHGVSLEAWQEDLTKRLFEPLDVSRWFTPAPEVEAASLTIERLQAAMEQIEEAERKRSEDLPRVVVRPEAWASMFDLIPDDVEVVVVRSEFVEPGQVLVINPVAISDLLGHDGRRG